MIAVARTNTTFFGLDRSGPATRFESKPPREHGWFKVNDVPIFVRDMTSHDRPFVVRTWKASAKAKTIVEPEIYDEWMPRLIDELLAQSCCLVAYRQESPETVHAFAVGEPNICLHYAYTAGEVRKMGIATELIRRATGLTTPMQMTCRGPALSSRYVFNPFLLRMTTI